jgi:hypothetical protein
MYNLLEKYKGIDDNWHYAVLIDDDGSIVSYSTKYELPQDELNSFIVDKIFEYQCNIDYLNLSKRLKKRTQFHDFEHLEDIQ